MVMTNFSEFTNILFFMAFLSIVIKTTKHSKSTIIIIIIIIIIFSYKEECSILNQLL